MVHIEEHYIVIQLCILINTEEKLFYSIKQNEWYNGYTQPRHRHNTNIRHCFTKYLFIHTVVQSKEGNHHEAIVWLYEQ